MIFALDYASPSVFESDRERALLGMSANARRPVVVNDDGADEQRGHSHTNDGKRPGQTLQ